MQEKVKILLCEDDENLGYILKEYFQEKNYAVDLFPDGEIGYEAFMKNKYDVCLLDITMPNKDGFSMAKDIRAIDTKTPIVFLTAKTLKEDVIKGLRIGADDYITKPFRMEELILRIEGILRRTNRKDAESFHIYKLGNFTFHSQIQQLIIDNIIIKLTTKEAELLNLLVSYPNNVVDRNFALKIIWNDESSSNARNMDVYIRKLRKHLEKDPNISIINIHGKGYKLIVP